jgi:hypothetical protein
MPGYNLSPLLTIPTELLHAVRGSQSYLDTATELLRDTLAFDFHLATASVAQPAGGGKDFYLDVRALEGEAAYPIFLRIRNRKEAIDEGFPLLQHAASILDYTAQMTINVLPMTQKAPRHFAKVSEKGDLSFPWNSNSMEHSLAAYLGISPFPFFLGDLDVTTPHNTALLSPFGFGVYATLAFTVIPELAVRGGVPEDIHRQWDARPIARGGIRSAPDGSFRL